MKIKLTLVALLTVFAGESFAYYPLQIILPRAANTAPDATLPSIGTAPALHSNHFTLWAYPGVEYRMRAAVLGGRYPYVYSLMNAPTGMTINSSTGEISWPNPQGTTSGNITLIVRDSDGLQASSVWSITVNADKFRFLDCDVATSGSGTINSPWQNIINIPANTVFDKILYFRDCSATGRYNALNGKSGVPRNGADRVDFNARFWPQQWLAYPGERPVFNHGYNPGVDTGASIRFQGSPAALVGFETVNAWQQHFNIITNMSYVTMWKNRMHRLTGSDGLNPAFIMTTSGANLEWSQYMIIQDNELYDYGGDAEGSAGAALKLYSLDRVLIEDNHVHSSVGTSDIEGIALKGNTVRATVRNNLIHNVHAHGIGGNQHTMANAEILHNRVYNCGSSCAYFNQDGIINTTIEIYRNTFVGTVVVDRVGLQSTTQTGGSANFRFANNVHVTSSTTCPGLFCFAGTRYTGYGVTNASLLQVLPSPNQDVLRVTADNCITPTGLLSDVGAERCRANYLGLKGAEISGPPVLPPPPRSPANLRVQ